MKIHTNSMNSYNRPKGSSVSKDMELEYYGLSTAYIEI